MVHGTFGYREDAEDFVQRTESVPFESKYMHFRHLIPKEPCRVLDIGAGCGADAAGFAALGHPVLAVEPVDELRQAGLTLHRSPLIEWGSDSLPELNWTRRTGRQFDVVLIIGVWMHLDEEERKRAMPNVASLLAQGGILLISLRKGPVPSTRRMFPVSGKETIRLAEVERLDLLVSVEAESLQTVNRQAGVTWTHLAFRSPA